MAAVEPRGRRTARIAPPASGETADLHALLEQSRSVAEELRRRNGELEEKARRLEAKAEQLALSSTYKSEFLANMSHELRTPLNSLLILAKLLSDNPDHNLSDKQIEFADTIHTAGCELLELVSDVLDLSKVEAGRMELSVTDVGLGELRERIERAFTPISNQKRLEFEVAVSDANAPPTISTDERRLEQILRNLLSNAFKFTDEGKVALTIEEAPAGDRYMNERLNHAERVIAFVVKDTGIGIPNDKLRLIFEAFQQADGATSRRYGGTGLGLSISRELAVLLGGEIRVESTPGVGSTFTLYLRDVHSSRGGRQ